MKKVHAYLFLLTNVIFLSSCNSEEKNNSEEIILGKWTISRINDEEINTHEGFRFAPNKQYFIIDSQGKIIPSMMEKVWSIHKDTLTLVDFNYEPQFIRTRGTQSFFIHEINDEILDISLEKKNETKRIILKKKNNTSTSLK